MPTLHWIGKEKVVNHHRDVPYKVLEHQYGFDADKGQSTEQTNSGNKIIQGDNLEALKSLLPEYEGKIKCIYIDPPYNTGNEKWVYNDNVNHPKIKKWLGEVVGKDGEDLSRHDKWLCMMYPRLKLLHQLLADDGAIFISIDDNEQAYLKLLCDEVFGKKSFLTNFTWRTDGNFDNQAKIKINHEYIKCYCKNIELFEFPELVDLNVEESSKIFKNKIVNTIVKNGIKNPISKITLPVGFKAVFEKGIIKARDNAFPYFHNDAIVENYELQNNVVIESGWSSKRIFELYLNNGLSPVIDTKNQLTEFYLTQNGAIESIKTRDKQSHVISSLMNMGSTQNMSNELKGMDIQFSFPKPTTLIKYIISIFNYKDFITLDSFAGSGTTAHAVLNLNKQDGGNRKFILIEMEDYADSITAERVKRVAHGYGEGKKAVDGTDGAFDYFQLGLPLFDMEHNLNEAVGIAKIREYIWYSETRSAFIEPKGSKDWHYFLGKKNQSVYYFIYQQKKLTTLNFDSLSQIKTKGEHYIIYADNCLLPKDFMKDNNIVFKKIPRDITRF